MSTPDTFIEEVTEEVRRDKLFAALKKWGWVGVLAVVLIVGGAVANEWMKAKARGEAEAAGDAILAALEAEDGEARVTALAALDAEGDRAALIGLITAAEAGSPEEAAAALAALASDPAMPALYRDLAQLKRAMLPGGVVSAEDRMTALEPLTAPGGAFRVLAEEQMALAEIYLGDKEAAYARLDALLQDTEASEALRRRASQLIVALGVSQDGGS